MEKISLSAKSWVELHQGFIHENESATLVEHLLQSLHWQQETIQLFGRKVLQPRLTAWLGIGASAASKYTQKLPATDWNETTTSILQRVEAVSQNSFNSVLVNQYRNGSDSMGYHADDEQVLGKNPVIASLSLGGTRIFTIKDRKTSETKLKLPLEDGSLLLMKGAMQHEFKHGIARTKKDVSLRLNLTFRSMNFEY